MKKQFMKWVIGAMGVLTLAACGAGNAKEQAEGSEAAGSNQLQEIKESGVLVVGTSADFAPYEWHLIKDGKDEIVGFDIDIVGAIAEELGVELEILDMDFDGLLPALTTGKVDLIAAAMTPTEERKKSVDFTDVYLETTNVVVIRKEDAEKYASVESLQDPSVRWAEQKGTIQETFVKESFPDAPLQSVGKWRLALMSLNTGAADAVLVADTVAKQIIKSNPELMIVDVDMGTGAEEAALAVAKDSGEFLETVNEIVNRMIEDGTIDQIVAENIQLMEDHAAE